MVSIQQFTPQRQATIARDGNTLIVNDAAHKDCRCPGDFFYAVELQHDSISIQGNNREQGQVGYQLGLSPQGVQVHSTLGRSEMIMNVASETPLSAQQQRDVGMNVASSLVGLPLLAIDETATATASATATAVR